MKNCYHQNAVLVKIARDEADKLDVYGRDPHENRILAGFYVFFF